MNYYFSISIHYHDGRIHEDAYRPVGPKIAGEVIRILCECEDPNIKSIILDIRRTVNQEKPV